MRSIAALTTFYKETKYKWLSFTAAAASGLLVYITFFQRNFFSKTYLAVSLLVCTVSFLLSLALNRFIQKKLIDRFPAFDTRLCVGCAVLLSLVLALNFSPIPFYRLLPDKEVQIEIPGGEAVKLVYMRNPLGYIPYSELQISGEWREKEKYLLLEAETGNRISWRGDADEFLEIAFQPSDSEESIHITVDGLQHEFDLQQVSGGDEAVFRYENPPTVLSQLPFILAFIFLAFYLLLLSLTGLCAYQIAGGKKAPSRKLDLILGVPLLITSLLTLFTFWPGILTNDSMNQWREAVSGNYSDLNPLLHTLLVSGLEKIAHSPAAVAIFQIIVFYLTLAYGLGSLRRRGVSPAVLAVLALLFALWPFNPLFSNVLWKDVLYSLALLALFILLIETALSEGKVLEDKKYYLLLGTAAFLVAGIRHNGSPVAFLTLALLPLVYKKYRKGLLLTLAAVLLAWAAIKGPIKTRLSSPSTPETDVNALNLTLLHHISAHLDAGSAMTEEQLNYLDDLLPLDEWQYDCCYMGNIYTHPEFDQNLLMQNTSFNLEMVTGLLRQNLMVDIQDQLCASEMDWRFLNNRCYFKSLHPFEFLNGEIISWIPDNDLGLEERSLLPGLVPVYFSIFDGIGVFDGYIPALLRPAFYLFLAVVALVGSSVRLRNKQLLTAVLPLVLQTGILALVNFAPAFRYQYGICLAGLFAMGLLFIPQQDE